MEKLIPKEEILLELSILALTLSMLLPGEFSVLIFGKTVQRKQKLMPIWILLTMLQFQRRKKWRSKMKLIESF